MSFFAKSRNMVCNGNGNIIVGNSGNGTIIVNGKKYQGNNVSIVGNAVYIDGQKAEEVTEKNEEGNIIINIEGNVSAISNVTKITVNGNVEKITDAGDINVTGNAGNIKDASNINVGGDAKEISDASNVTVKGKVFGDIYDCSCVSR